MYNIDDFFDTIKSNRGFSNMPHYNIRYCSENTSAIDVACPGFSTDDIKVVTERQRLSITGTKNSDGALDNDSENYVFRGISTSDFKMSFKLHEYAVIKTVTLVNGILSVYIELVIPENKQTKVIPISTDPVSFAGQRVTVSDDAPVLLTEDTKEK